MNLLNRLPPLNALRAFEAVARRLSFARAAEELYVTKAAVAQQVRALEQEIGARLVERSGRGLQLTESGAAGAATLTDGFALLAQGRARDARGQGAPLSGHQFERRRSPRPGSSAGSASSRRAIRRPTC